MKKNIKQGGFILKLVVIIIAIILIASYFKFDLKSFIEAPETQNNINYSISLVQALWTNFLEAPVMAIWDNYLSVVIKDSFIQGIDNLKAISSGNPSQFNLIPSAVPENWVSGFKFGKGGGSVVPE